MNAQQSQRPVVVGVDGTADNVGALRYAAAEAAALDAPLRLVHVVPDLAPAPSVVPPGPPASSGPVDLTQVGAAILDEAVAQVAALAPDVRTEVSLRHGTRAAQLAEAGDEAQVLVVGRDDRPLLERLLRGDTATGVAARASTPVVEVPVDWQPGTHGVVVVGVKSPSRAAELLADAFAVARRSHARLVVLHAWKLPSVYDDIIEARVDLDEWQGEASRELDTLVGDWRKAYPDVPVELEVVHDHAGHALVEASRGADLVIVARRKHGRPVSAHLGSTARSVLRASQCPVRVIAPVGLVPIPSLTVESGGALER